MEDRFITKGSDKWSEAIYNEDGDFKYISMLRSDNDATNLPQVRGSGEEHFRYFIENRLNYCDSKWYASDYANDYISLRIYTPSTWSGVEPDPAITVTPFSNMYAGVRYKANGTLYQERATHGVPVTFRPKGETFESENNESFNDTETAVYGAHQLSSIGDLAPLYCGSINVSNADKLIELKVGDATEGYSNANLRELSVGTNKLLKKIDVRNCPNFASVLELSNCPGIEEVYATGTAITGVEFPESGCLRIAHLPASIANLTIKHQLYIEDLTIAGYDNLKTLCIENCPAIDALDILSKATNVERVRLTDLDLKYDSAAEMLALTARSIGGIDENGVNIDKMWLDGKCHIKALTGSELATIVNAFPYLTITYEVLTSNLIFMSEDGTTELGRQAIQNGADGNYTGNIPTKDSTAQYHFTFVGWSLTPGGSVDADALKNVEADRYVYAAFSGALRSYTVKFYNGSTLLQTVTVKYGTTATYTGDTPVNNSTGNPADFEFYGWNPAPTNIQGDTSCYAQFHDLREITDSWATIAANVANGTATSKYAVGAFKMLNIGEVSLPYDFNQGSAVVYNGEIHILGSVVSGYRTSHYKWDGTEWVEVGTIPYEFYYGSAVVFNDEIHILGGSSSSSGRTKHYKWDGSNWTSVSTLPYVFEKGVAIVYDNEIHIMGSGNSSNYTSHYKWNGSTWSEVGKLPYSFYTASGFIYNNEIHVLGSYDSNYETAHYKYDGSSWTPVNTLPQKLSNGHALAIGADIYMIQWDEFYKYDGASWHACPDVPANVYDGRSVVLDDNIYVMGSSVSGNGRVFYSYAPETSKWSKVGITESIPMQIVAHNHDELPDGVGKWENIGKTLSATQQYGCAVAYNNEVHVLGGNNATTYTRHVKWDATNSSWATVSTLPYQFRSGCAVVLNDEIHILGSYQTTNKTEHYKWNGTEWTSVSTLPYEFYCASAVVLNGEIHILGSYYSSNRKSHYKWNGTEWVSVSTMSYNFYYGCAVVYGDEIHIFGGSGASTGHYKWNETDGWTEVSTLPYDFSSGAAGVLNNEIHIFGGSDTPTTHYKWNGTEWVSVSTLPDDFYNSPLATCNDTPYMFINTTCYKLAGASLESNGKLPFSSYVTPNAVEFNNKLYAINDERRGLHVFDGDSWTKVITFTETELPDRCASLVVYNNELHIISGTSHIKFNEETSTCVSVSTLPAEAGGGGICVYNGDIHVLGNEYTASISSKLHMRWNESDGWVSLNDLPSATGKQCAIYNGTICIMCRNNIYAWDENNDTWNVINTNDGGFDWSSTVVYNNELYCFGSYANPSSYYKFNGTEWVLMGDLGLTLYNYDSVYACVYGAKIHLIGNINNVRNSHYILTNPRATLTFLAGNLLKDDRAWNATGGNAGGWLMSDIRTYCNGELLASLPSDLQNSISVVKKYSDRGYRNYDIGSSEDYLWLLSSTEIGNSQRGLSGQGGVYPVFTDMRSAVAYKVDGTASDQWLRSSLPNMPNHSQYITAMANVVNMAQTTVLKAFRFGFCI